MTQEQGPAYEPTEETTAEALKIVGSLLFGAEWTWKVERQGHFGAIRGTIAGDMQTTYCPITALARVRHGKAFPQHEYGEASKALSMDIEVAYLIARAADDYPGIEKDVRNALLSRLGLEEIEG